MTIRDDVDRVVEGMTGEQLFDAMGSVRISAVSKQGPSDAEWKKQMLDYHFFHDVDHKRIKAIERICQALRVPTLEERQLLATERSAEAAQCSANAAQHSAESARSNKWASWIAVGISIVALLFSLKSFESSRGIVPGETSSDPERAMQDTPTSSPKPNEPREAGASEDRPSNKNTAQASPEEKGVGGKSVLPNDSTSLP